MQSQKNSNTEAKRSIATHSDSSVDMTHVKRHWQPRSEMWLTFSEILHQLSIKSLFENAILRLLPTSHSKNWQSCFFRLRHFAVQCSENYSKKREKKNNYLPKGGQFWEFTSKFWMFTSFWWRQYFKFGRGKQLRINRSPIHVFLSVRKCKHTL